MHPEKCQDLNIIIWLYNPTVSLKKHRLHNIICVYSPVVRLMAVEDEMRVGAIPDIKPRILTDQVCACVYIFYHPYLLNRSCPKTACIILTSHSVHLPKPEKCAAVKHFTFTHLSKVRLSHLKKTCHHETLSEGDTVLILKTNGLMELTFMCRGYSSSVKE